MAKVLTLTTDGRNVEIENRIVIPLTSQNATAGSAVGTDYIFLCIGTCTITLPTAVANFNKYTVKNAGIGSDTINTSLSQTVDGSLTIQLLVENQSVDIISNGSNWLII